MKYVKTQTGKLVEAVQAGRMWILTHDDGNKTTLTDAKFSKRYVKEEDYKKDDGSKEAV